MSRILPAIIISLFLSSGLLAQEFICHIRVQAPRVEGIDKTIFETMQTSLFEFVNNTKWTNYNFKIEERIECTFLITINEAISSDEFKGTMNVVLQRPIYRTDYNSVVVNLIDQDIQFRYVPFQPLEYSENSYSNNLTSLMAYYAYLLLGLDFDTYSLEGGSPFYEKARSVVSAAQNSPMPGWQSFQSQKNRYHLVENLQNASYRGLRTFLYEYHRKGLDAMSEDESGGRTQIASTLKNLKTVYDKRPGLYALQVFTEAKRDEIINIFKKASPAEQNGMINIMKEVDPANGSRYEAVIK